MSGFFYIKKMTVTELLNRIHVLLEKDTDYPTSTDEDYLLRLEVLKDSVMIWEKDNESGNLWSELFTTLADSDVLLGGDKVTKANESVYDCPSDFVFPASYLKIGSGDNTIYYKKISPEQVPEYDKAKIASYYIRGNKSVGYKIHLIGVIPEEDDLVIDYDYYKQATIPTTGADVLEMSDPQFSVYWVLSELTKDDDPALASQYQQVALNKLDAMRLRNSQPSYGQDNLIFDQIGGFGK